MTYTSGRRGEPCNLQIIPHTIDHGSIIPHNILVGYTHGHSLTETLTFVPEHRPDPQVSEVFLATSPQRLYFGVSARRRTTHSSSLFVCPAPSRAAPLSPSVRPPRPRPGEPNDDEGDRRGKIARAPRNEGSRMVVSAVLLFPSRPLVSSLYPAR